MIKIRRGTFETNSSSVHTIAIKKEFDPEKYRGGYVKFDIGEFGWAGESFDSADYLYTYCIYMHDNDLLDKIKELLDKYEIKYDFEEPVYNSTYGYLENGYIDHADNLAELIGMLKKDDNLLLSMILDGSAYGGNDNCFDCDLNEKCNHFGEDGYLSFTKYN